MLLIVIFALGTYYKWYFGIIFVIATFLFTLVAKIFVSNDLERYLLKIIDSLVNREANYRENNDIMRAEATADVKRRLEYLFADIEGKKLSVEEIIK